MREKVTIYTLAEELGVSPSAVSRAFNPETRLSPDKRKRILAAAAKYGFTPNRAAARLSMRDIRIGAVIVNRIPDFYNSMYEGLNVTAQKLAQQKVIVDTRMLRPGDHNVEQLIETLNDFQANHYDGVILHGIYAEDIIYKINELADAGIPVATLINDIPTSKRLFTSTSNTQMAGAIAAELLNTYIRSEQKNVVLFTGSMSSPIHQQILMSFSASCAAYGMTLLQSYDTMDVPTFAEKLVEDAFRTHEKIDGIYCCSANSLPVCEYLEKHGYAGKVAMVTSDTFPRLNEKLRSGTVNATIYQDPYRQGKNALSYLYRYITEKELPPQVLMAYPQIVLKSNLELYEGERKTDEAD